MIQLIGLEVLLQAGIEDLNVSPLEVLKVVLNNMLFKGLCNVKRIPLMRSSKSAILLGICSGNINLFLGARERLYL